MRAMTNISQEEPNTPRDHLRCADNPSSGGERFWGQVFSQQCNHCCGELLSVTSRGEKYRLKSKLFPLEDSLQRQRLILVASQQIQEQLGNAHSIKCLGGLAH